MSAVRKITSLTGTTYFYVDFLKEVEEEIQKKAFLVSSGLDSFTRAELFAYEALKANGYFPFTPSEETDPLSA
jgi:hypothetical protein